MLAAAGALGESFEVREFRKKWSVPPLLLLMGSKCLNQPRCMAMEKQEVPDHCLPHRNSGKGTRLGLESCPAVQWGRRQHIKKRGCFWKGNGKITGFF